MTELNGECVVLSTCPTLEVAKSLAARLVSQQLAACVNILPQVLSCYQWKGQVEQQVEHLLLIKTHSARFDDVAVCIRAMIPYEIPEILALPVLGGSQNYLAWMAESMSVPARPRGREHGE